MRKNKEESHYISDLVVFAYYKYNAISRNITMSIRIEYLTFFKRFNSIYISSARCALRLFNNFTTTVKK